jgi:hypothetical protein
MLCRLVCYRRKVRTRLQKDFSSYWEIVVAGFLIVEVVQEANGHIVRV